MRISDWSSDVCSSDLDRAAVDEGHDTDLVGDADPKFAAQFHQRCATKGVVVGVQRTDELAFVAADRTAAAGVEATGSGQGLGLLADDGADLGPAGPHAALGLAQRMVHRTDGGSGAKQQAASSEVSGVGEEGVSE